MATWYRTHGGAYHLAPDDYVKTGRAACGRNVGRAGYVTSNPYELAAGGYARVCKACAAIDGRPGWQPEDGDAGRPRPARCAEPAPPWPRTSRPTRTPRSPEP